ncbi:hypothetical protein OXPF_14760 [Oxobacter pfennigii]|uniref:Uncharacterized protein n=1 Tax=Oxobacter pfennigii TaxID=36849 RepID=A0A0P8YCU5_9CLOT|nr:hypothetical protein [Oxobacter pfennigii]KPU44998.1 hypothetical protein OXPF_14760 [Oxobacter pfennigii]
MKGRKKLWLILSCLVILLGSFGFGYYSTLNSILGEKTLPQPGKKVDYKYFPISDEDKDIDIMADEERVTPQTILEKKIISINTGKSITTESHIVPDELVNMTRLQVEDFFDGEGRVDFTKEKILIIRELPYLPDRFVVRLENKYIMVYSTDSNGIATKCDDFEPIPHKNKDKNLETGIEVETEEEVWEKIRDYD